MKGYACLLLTLSLAVLGEGFLVGIIFPPKDKVCRSVGSKDPVAVPHEKCSHFYVCTKGKAKLQQCPPGQHFNKELQFCDHPDNARCEVKPNDSTQWAVIDLRSQAKDAPFSLLSLIPSNAITANNLTYDAALKTIQDNWVKGQEEKKKVQTEGPRGLEHKGHGKRHLLHTGRLLQRSVHVRPGHYNQPLLQGTYPRGTYEAQQQDNYDRIFPLLQTRPGARPAKYPSGPYADAQGKFRRYPF